MANMKDMPLVKGLFDNLMESKDAIEKQMAPLWDEYNVLQAQVDPYLVQMREIASKIKQIKADSNLVEVCNQLSALAKVAGGRSTSDPVPQGDNVMAIADTQHSEVVSA